MPHVTVAAVIEKNNRFLVVRENLNPPVLNQPAGHLEKNESLLQAIEREVLEETAYIFKPAYLIGIYRWTDKANETYVRFCFAGNVLEQTTNTLDPDILEALWLDKESIMQNNLRSRMVMQCINDYCKGTQYDLTILSEMV